MPVTFESVNRYVPACQFRAQYPDFSTPSHAVNQNKLIDFTIRAIVWKGVGVKVCVWRGGELLHLFFYTSAFLSILKLNTQKLDQPMKTVNSYICKVNLQAYMCSYRAGLRGLEAANIYYNIVCAISENSGETAHMRSLA